MKPKYKRLLYSVLISALLLGLFFLLSALDIAVLNPKGAVAHKERSLFFKASLLMLIVVIPVFTLTFFISWKYREGNAKAKHSPEWDHSLLAETVWWGVPCVITLILGVMIWTSSHELDPFSPLKSSKKPVVIQVVALQWKWLFIYPEQKIATVNFIQFPEGTPVNFEITADAPMNSFWIPELGGQIYAMSGMKTKLHLIANETGSYRGSSANLSGEGFSGMEFVAQSSSENDFQKWVENVKQEAAPLDEGTYRILTKPSTQNPVAYYRLQEEGLFERIIMDYMMPKRGL